MIVSSDQLLFENRAYRDPHHRIQAMVRRGELFPLKRGLYETEENAPGYALANALYGPSYLSFEYALSRYGMIPERVRVYTCATFGKNRSREFSNRFGTFTYRDIPAAVFPFHYTREQAGSRAWLIATPEKALCDALYALEPMRAVRDFEEYLFDGMRLDEDAFFALDFDKIRRIAPLYRKTNLDQLVRLADRRL